MVVTFDMDVRSFCDGFNNHHIGILRCRQEGASMPSTEPITGSNQRGSQRAFSMLINFFIKFIAELTDGFQK